jgi:DNA helicase II / ATP-dependent DNA helicase PcrA
MSETVGLIDSDDGQRAVVDASGDARLLVVAGPGTGKTRTLLARAEHLIDQEEMEQAYDLLILSFSRAAVKTVARRVDSETELGRLRVMTIDSLASRILIGAGQLLGMSTFDERIEAARVALEEDLPGVADLLPARHVLVDEAQDIVGVRATFVKALLDRVCSASDAGFTVFGDPAQAIYDFQLKDGQSSRLIDLLTTDKALGTVEAELTTNHRMLNSRLVDLSQRFGRQLRLGDETTNWADVQLGIEAEIALEEGWASAATAGARIEAVLERPGHPRIAVLTRTNAEALRLGMRLQREGLDVAIQHRLEERGGAPWLTLLFGGAQFNEVRVPVDPVLDGVPVWFEPPVELGRTLRDAQVAQKGTVDLRRLATMLRRGVCPEELVARRDAAVTVSTIHRAKGLEFDTVFVVRSRGETVESSIEEARVVYVAATRARVELLQGAPLTYQGEVINLPSERVGVGSSRWNLQYLEVKVSDSDPDWAPDDRAGFDRLQRFLVEGVQAGDLARLDLRDDSGRSNPIYDLVHIDGDGGSTIVGRTSAAFGKVIQEHAGGRPPKVITGLVADIPDTVVMAPGLADRLGLGEHGFHLRARVYGLPWMN